MFPDFDNNAIRAAIIQCKGNIEAAVDALLNGTITMSTTQNLKNVFFLINCDKFLGFFFDRK